MRTSYRTLLLVLWVLALGACATPRFPTEQIALDVTPGQAKADMSRLEGTRVLWGGTIVNATNKEDSTRLEILAYPLDGDQRPDLEEPPQGRFLALEEGYLETASYAPGREVTVSGRLTGLREGMIGEAAYSYPVVEVVDIQLWKEDRGSAPGSNFRFGIGVIFGG
ncbi:Slp family lipoprotein [Thiohalorhabdus methylotrophus]|uniref:Slp family lipoprotein n=1 Tax=Thiohalorhabdus methylotrophus TaxID=3242694 RepID=A0ABV4U0R0_9GAMM